MGASTSRIEEDKALQLCRERKKFVRQALDGRCSLAAAHVSYVQSLKNTGTALRKFAETEVPAESSLYTSTSATPEPLALMEKSVSQFSHPSPSGLQCHNTYSPSPSPPPPSASRFQVNHMKFKRFSSKKVEEKPPVSVTGTVTSSSIPQSAAPESIEKVESTPFEESSSTPPETPPWDYFGLAHPLDDQLSASRDRKEGGIQVSKSGGELRRLREEEGIAELEEGEKASLHSERENSRESDDEFDEPSTDTLVRRFENFNRVHDHNAANALPKKEDSESEFSDEEKSKTPDLSPSMTPSAVTPVPMEMNKTPTTKEDTIRNKLPPRDFFSDMKEIELLFIKASESGKEVPRMLEANKLHFRPIIPAKESGSNGSSLLKSCFSCGEDHTNVQEEPPQDSIKYITWHRTESSRSSSSRNPLGGLNSDGVEEYNADLFDNICKIAGGHASTLDRLYAWERKLYDEVKASQMVRREYDQKCKELREFESGDKSKQKIDKIRAVVKDLHSRIRVAIHRIDSISKRIEELRDKELQPQLEELIEGMSRMWEVMWECHKIQFRIISASYKNCNIKLNMQSELHGHVTSDLEDKLITLSSSFTKWITAQKSYIQAINYWLDKCVSFPQNTSKRRRFQRQISLRDFGPPIYATCGVWLEKLEALPTKEVSNSVKTLASDVARFLPRQEKNQSKKLGEKGNDLTANMIRDEALEDCVSGFDRFKTSSQVFMGQLSQFAELSVKMYEELKQDIRVAKSRYEQLKSFPQVS